MLTLGHLPKILAAALLLASAPVTAYPIYKFGLFQGEAGTTDACGAGGRRNKCFVWDLADYPTCYKFSETESYSGAQYDATSLTYDLHPTSSE